MKSEQPSAEDQSYTHYLKVAAFTLCIVWGIVFLITLVMACSPTAIQRFALIGDSFGSLNSLFSMIALMAAIAGIWLQGKQFNTQLNQVVVQNSLIRQQMCEDAISREISFMPHFELRLSINGLAAIVEVCNYGYEVSAVKFECSCSKYSPNLLRFTSEDKPKKYTFEADNPQDNETITISISYTRASGARKSESFTFVQPYPIDKLLGTNREFWASDIRNEMEKKYGVQH